jgi:phage terminase Nu1 subunit (DNA packaging protein)
MQPTQSQIATVLGVSQGRVAQLKKSGMPVDSTTNAMAWYVARTKARHGMPPPSQPKRPPPEPPADGEQIDAPEEYHKARARREAAEADIAERKAAELTGELVRRSVFVVAAERKANTVRESLLQMPAQMAPVVAAESDVAKCQDALMDAVLGILARINA